MIVEHISALVLEAINRQGRGALFKGAPRQFCDLIQANLNVEIPEPLMIRALDTLVEAEFGDSVYSPLTNGFYIFQVNDAIKRYSKQYLRDRSGIVGPDDAYILNSRDLMQRFAIIRAYAEGGSEWADMVAQIIRQDSDSGILGDTTLPDDDKVPASDRTVSIDHNRRSEMETPLNDVLEQIEAHNGDPDDLGFRERAIGQLRAGRELIRVGVFKVWLFEQTVLTMLGELVAKYGPTALGVAAKKALEMLIEAIAKAP